MPRIVWYYRDMRATQTKNGEKTMITAQELIEGAQEDIFGFGYQVPTIEEAQAMAGKMNAAHAEAREARENNHGRSWCGE